MVRENDYLFVWYRGVRRGSGARLVQTAAKFTAFSARINSVAVKLTKVEASVAWQIMGTSQVHGNGSTKTRQTLETQQNKQVSGANAARRAWNCARLAEMTVCAGMEGWIVERTEAKAVHGFSSLGLVFSYFDVISWIRIPRTVSKHPAFSY